MDYVGARGGDRGESMQGGGDQERGAGAGGDEREKRWRWRTELREFAFERKGYETQFKEVPDAMSVSYSFN